MSENWTWWAYWERDVRWVNQLIKLGNCQMLYCHLHPLTRSFNKPSLVFKERLFRRWKCTDHDSLINEEKLNQGSANVGNLETGNNSTPSKNVIAGHTYRGDVSVATSAQLCTILTNEMAAASVPSTTFENWNWQRRSCLPTHKLSI